MKEQNVWKLAVMVFVISIAFVLAGGGIVANANDRDGKKSFHHDDGDIGNLFVTADTVLGGGPPGTIPGVACSLTNQFYAGNNVIFRIRVSDDNSHFLNNHQLTEVYVRILDTGEEINAVYGTHPPPPDSTDAYWVAVYHIPPERTGSFSYEVVAIAPKHRVGTFRPFDVDASLLTIVEP